MKWALAPEYGCTAASSMTWVEDRALRLFANLRDANGRMSSHAFVGAINRQGTRVAGLLISACGRCSHTSSWYGYVPHPQRSTVVPPGPLTSSPSGMRRSDTK